jgi:hypothetical protein
LLLLLLVPCMLFPGALPGSSVVSADDHLTVHHAFQSKPGGRVAHPQLSDPALQFAAIRARVVDALRAGEVPLWNPDIWTGAPLLGDGQSMVGSPVTWAHVFWSPDTAQDVGVAWVLLWTGLGTMLLAGRLGAGPWGAATAGAAAMMGPYTQVWLLHPHAATFAWLPWVLLGIERRRWAWIAVASAGLVAGGHPQTAAHGLMLATVWTAWRGRWRDWGVGACLGLCLAAPIWLPFAEEVLRSASVAAHGGNRLAPAQLLDLLWPGWHGHPAAETWVSRQWAWSDGRLHPGLGVMLLVGVALLRRARLARWLVMFWAACVLLACLGFVGPINHARLGSMGAWFLALVAGLGVQQLSLRWRGLMMGVVIATCLWNVRFDQQVLAPEAHSPAPAAWTQALRTQIGCNDAHPSVSGCGRVIGLGWALQPNTGPLVGLPDLRGYDLPVSVDTERLMSALRSPPSRPWFAVDTLPALGLLRWSSVRAIVSAEPLLGLPAIAIGNAPVFAHRLNASAPRAWIATAPQAVDTPEQSIEQLSSAAFSRPPVEHLKGAWPREGRVYPVDWAPESPQRYTLYVDSPQRGLLVLSQAWHPGWRASIDANPVELLRVGGVFTGLVLTPGAHTVSLEFAPWGWRLGKVVALLCLLILALFVSCRHVFSFKWPAK